MGGSEADGIPKPKESRKGKGGSFSGTGDSSTVTPGLGEMSGIGGGFVVPKLSGWRFDATKAFEKE